MNVSTLAGLNLPQWPTSAEDIHICYLQYAIYNIFKSFLISSYSTCDIPSHPNSSSNNFTMKVLTGVHSPGDRLRHLAQAYRI